MAISYYDILGVAEDANEEAIRNGYLKAMRDKHPDLHSGDDARADRRVRELNAARDTLTNPELRRKYDQQLQKIKEAAKAASAPQASDSTPPTRTEPGKDSSDQDASEQQPLWNYNQIATELNRRGIPSPRDKTWHGEIIKGILENPSYRGDTVSKRFRSGQFYGIDENHETAKVGELGDIVPIEHRNTHDEIISREQWKRAQELIANRTRKRSKTRAKSLMLSGILFCGHCDRKLDGGIHKGKFVRYRCKECNRCIREDHISPITLQTVGSQIEELRRKEFEVSKSPPPDPLAANCDRIEKEIAAIEKREKKAQERFKEAIGGEDDEIFKDATDALKADRLNRGQLRHAQCRGEQIHCRIFLSARSENQRTERSGAKK